MTALQRIQREPVLVTGVLVAAVGLAIILGLDPEVAGGISLLGGALITLVLRGLVTPAAEVVVQQRPDGELVAGEASVVPTGDVLASVGVTPLDELPPDVTDTDLPPAV